MTTMLRSWMSRSPIFFIAWCIVAAFGAYFCMYAFRKPFTAGTYEQFTIGNVHYKTILIIAQVIGYMCSKWMGIKVISEMKASSRQVLIIGLIVFAEVSLVLFGMVPAPYNFMLLFLNGLPLGMVWGVIFAYLEGRRFTETLGMGLSISLIVSSGFLKTIYFRIAHIYPAVSEFWLPAIIGLIFLPAFLLFSWMLSVIPEPDEHDKSLRSERLPMTAADKQVVLKKYGPGVFAFVFIYMLLSTMRDFRDNFSVEIWNEIQPGWNAVIFSKTETIIGFVVLASIASISLFRDNLKGFAAVQILIVVGLSLCGLSTLAFTMDVISPFIWMLTLGAGMFLAYTPIQVALYERMIALFKIRGNAGFFVYISDAFGYMGSVILLFYKEFFTKDLQWSEMLIQFSYMLCVLGLLASAFAWSFFFGKSRQILQSNSLADDAADLHRSTVIL